MNAPFRPAALALREADLRDPGELARLERLVAEHPEGSPFHRPAWLVAVARGTGNRAVALVAEQGGDLAAFLPLIEAHSPLFGRVIVSSGFAVGGGILAIDERAGRELLGALEELALRRSCPSAELRGGLLPKARAGWSIRKDSHCNFAADLAADDEAQLTWIPRKQRAEVRKGLANDLTIEIGCGAGDRAAHYAVYAESVRNLGTPVFPKSLFHSVLDAFGDDADILTVRHQGRPVASVLSLYHKGAVMPYWGGGTWEARRLRANDRMYYELMLHARRRGCTRFDFGRSKTGSGPYDFKRNWGFEPEPLSYASWTAPGAAPRDADPTSAGNSAKIELWKRLPLPIANLIGPHVARGLA
ncbi:MULTISPECIES: FemAB family XrtA/PEP-CTERM system-associated protein [unclassified Novosphingobium]|uniref:FemAB family XrtA/PEP-CTERM system-associated protein n=1 Tax=unclassified Novosphingobium TaxID=2644732 RepID=UPI0025FFF0E3|nr:MULTISPECIES: FemAB family XrtA/PEP-CTERM system-associated protein [unclassified Novosphingobium]HQV02601.1 FemAB family PEP-CTERM system-associated protein [Novosphingobium sp.]